VSIWFDITLGLILAGALTAWVPFLAIVLSYRAPDVEQILGTDHWSVRGHYLVRLLGRKYPARRGPVERGISFGGVVAFILADLIVLPILDIYRRYYGAKMSLFILATFYVSMSLASLVIEFTFQGLGLIPLQQAKVVEASLQFDYTAILNIIFLGVAGFLVWRFFTTGGPEMLRQMNRPVGEERTTAIPDMASERAHGSHKYICPMHPDVIQDQPGNCPKCGMKLIRPGKPEQFKTGPD
jgi:uncharacterized membrane protein YraQ (UPF0718 family)